MANTPKKKTDPKTAEAPPVHKHEGRVEEYRKLAQEYANGTRIMLPSALTGQQRSLHVLATLREDHQIRIEEQLHSRPFGPEDPLLVEHKWFVRCQYGQVSRKPLVAFPSDLFEMFSERRIVRCHGGLCGVRCEPPSNLITEFGLGHVKTAANGDAVEPKPHRVGRPRRIMFFASPDRDAEVRLVRRLVV